MTKVEIWKPKAQELCPECGSRLYLSSIVPENGQINFGCLADDCPSTGFIHRGVIYFSVREGSEDEDN